VSDDEAYRTLAGPGCAQFTVRGSEFFGHARPVEVSDPVATAEAFIEEIRAEYDDATHNVPAYRVRADPFREYAADAGEPSGSAGDPALNVLRGRDLENVAVVVTRYYGGTNPGGGGLVRADARATKEAVTDAGTVEAVARERLRGRVAYDDSGTVRGILESEGVEFEADYDETVVFEVTVPTATAADLRDRLPSATSGRVELDADD
jgi:uncharacterized YigZ family protein